MMSPEQLIAWPRQGSLFPSAETLAYGAAVLTDRRFDFHLQFTEVGAHSSLGPPVPGDPPWSGGGGSSPLLRSRGGSCPVPPWRLCTIPLQDLHAIYRVDPTGREGGLGLTTVYGGFLFTGADPPAIMHRVLRAAMDGRQLELGLLRSATPIRPYCGTHGDPSQSKCPSFGPSAALSSPRFESDSG